MTKFYNKYSMLSDRDTNFSSLPNLLFEESGFHQKPINDKFEVDLNPENKIDLTNIDLAKNNENTLYCHSSKYWFAYLNKDRSPYYYNCLIVSNDIFNKVMHTLQNLMNTTLMN